MARPQTLYTSSDCAEALDRSPLTIYNWLRAGKIKSFARTRKGIYLFTKEAILDAKKRQRTRTRN